MSSNSANYVNKGGGMNNNHSNSNGSFSVGNGSNSNSSSGGANERVLVNIYDMYTMNNYISALGVGIYHCGVEVYGVEYGYGGHPFPFSGVFEMVPKDSEELGESFKFKESIEIGRTDFTKSEIDQIIQLIGREFRGIDYHLINKNCNTFSSKFCKTICGQDIPSWVNRLAYISTFVPFIERMIPREWISPIAIQHTLESHMNEPSTANGTSSSSASLQNDANNKSNGSANGNNSNNNTNGLWSYLFNGINIVQQPSNQQPSTNSPSTSSSSSSSSTTSQQPTK